jgi:hypothetical protein
MSNTDPLLPWVDQKLACFEEGLRNRAVVALWAAA